MPNTLYIKKLSNGFFEFTLNGDIANKVTNTRNDLTAFGNELHFKTSNGANIVKNQQITPTNCTLDIDGAISSFSTVSDAFSKLKIVGYFDWMLGGTGGGGSGGVDRFEDLLDTFSYEGKQGMTVIVNETLQRLEPVKYRLIEKSTDLDDVPDILLPNKMLATNEDGTEIIFKELPVNPEQFLNAVGWFMYNDLSTQVTPIPFVTNVDKKLTNDGNGAGTNSAYAPFGISRVWDTTVSQLNLSELSLGDILNMRLLIETTTTSTNQVYTIKLKSAIGTPVESSTVIQTDTTKAAGVKLQAFSIQAVVSSDFIKNFPSEFYINSDGNGSIKIKGFLFSVIRRNINVIQLGVEGLDLKEDKIRKVQHFIGNETNPESYPSVPAVIEADNLLQTQINTIVNAVAVHPIYIAPSSSINLVNSLFEIGQSITANITQTFVQNDGGPKTSETITKNGSTVATASTFSETYTGVQGILIYGGSVSYSQGNIKNNNLGLPDAIGRIPAGTTTSPIKTYEFVYPIFATTSAIATLTKQTNVSMVTGNNIIYALVAESGGNKQKIDIPTAWITARPLLGIQQLNTVSGLYEYPGGSAATSLALWTISDVTQTIQGNTVNYKRRTYNGSDRSNVTIKLIF